MERITWNQFFMAQCHLLAVRSTCTRLAVGAIIVRDNRIIAGGYNGSVSGGDHCIDKGCYVVDNHCVRTIHAEMNAVLQCAKYGTPTADATVYVTHFPCLQCTKALIQAGIQQINYATDYRNNEYAMELLEHAGVWVNHIPFDEKKIDFTSVEKMTFMNELIDKIETLGIDNEEVNTLRQRVDALFGYY